MTVDAATILVNWLTTNPGHTVSTTLDGAITATATTLDVADGSGFPAATGPFVVLIGTELLLVTASGNALTLFETNVRYRGAFGTTAAAHADGVAVHQAVLYDVSGTSVWTPRAPDGYENTVPGIALQTETAAHVNANTRSGTALIKLHPGSSSYAESRAMSRLLSERLHNKTGDVEGGGLMEAYELADQPLPQADKLPSGWVGRLMTFAITVGG